jgi:hypothetical protein
MRWDEHPPNPERLCQLTGMKRAGPPKCHQGEVSRVVSALDSDFPNGSLYVRVGHTDHTPGGGFHGQAKPTGKFQHPGFGTSYIELHLSAQKVLRMEAT